MLHAADISHRLSRPALGSSTCTRPDGAELRQGERTAEITPYDQEKLRGVCTDDLRPYPREVALRFSAPGEALIRVRGRGLRGEPNVVVEFRVFVRQ